MIRILSLPGGGIRGALTAALLRRLEQRVPGIVSRADLLAGTSTGGLLALALAAGHPPEAILDLYRDQGPRIFDRRRWRALRLLGNLLGPRHPGEELHAAVSHLFGDAVLGDLRRVLVPAFDLDNGDRVSSHPRRWKAKFFGNPPRDPDCHLRVVDVAMATSAAPTYLPSWDGFIDGGVVANDPSMAALAHVLDHRADPRCPVDDVVCLTVGTGHVPRWLGADTSRWGLLRWAPVLVDLMMDGAQDVSAYQVQQLLGDRYHRLAVRLAAPVRLDDAAAVPRLLELAEQVDLDPVVAWLQRWWTPRAAAA